MIIKNSIRWDLLKIILIFDNRVEMQYKSLSRVDKFKIIYHFSENAVCTNVLLDNAIYKYERICKLASRKHKHKNIYAGRVFIYYVNNTCTRIADFLSRIPIHTILNIVTYIQKLWYSNNWVIAITKKNLYRRLPYLSITIWNK